MAVQMLPGAKGPGAYIILYRVLRKRYTRPHHSGASEPFGIWEPSTVFFEQWRRHDVWQRRYTPFLLYLLRGEITPRESAGIKIQPLVNKLWLSART